MNINISEQINKLIRYFHPPEKTAKLAKERLQIIIAHERMAQDNPDYLALLQKDLLDVITKYVAIDRDNVKVDVARKDGFSILELNVTLPPAG